jgi:cell division protein FtsW
VQVEPKLRERVRRPALRVLGPEDRPSRRAVRRQRRATQSGVDRSVGILLVSTALLVGTGLIMVFSASSVTSWEANGSSFTFFNRQLMYAVLASAGMLVTSRMRVAAWQRLALPLTVVSGVLLLAVLAVGTRAGGSARWIAVGPVTVQPSEIAKLAMVALTATVLTRKWKLLRDPVQVALPLLPIVGVMCLLVLVQPDLGTMMVIAATVFCMLFVAGVRLKHMAVGGGLGLSLGFLAIASESYRWSRFTSFLDPMADPSGKGYHLIQSLIGFASGSWLGLGLGASRQKWDYVPNAHTDFIFSIIGEELGILGAVLLLLVFGALLFAGIRIALRAPDRFSRLLAAGIVSWIGFQTIVNLGAVTGVLPITGVPLPFVSYGGSALVVMLAAMGILVRIGRDGTKARARA